MSHFPKPFYRKPRKRWYVELDGRQINLGPDKDAAFVEYRRLMAERDAKAPTSTVSDNGLTVAEVYDKFLTWCKQNREPLTYKGYHEFIQGLIDHLKEKALLPACKLRPFHITEWVDAHKQWGDTRRRNAIVHTQRPYSWAFKLGYIPSNPIRHIEKPRAQRRDNHVTPEDFHLLIGKVAEGDPFRDLLVFAWETGCRPQEARHIEPRHVNLPAARIEIPPGESKGRKRWRIIFLTDAAAAIVSRLLRSRTGGKLFLNTDGVPWKNQAIVCRFQRLKKKLGKRFACYDLRHGFAQKLLENGADHLAVAELMGHVNGNMLSTVYSHMSKADSHLKDTLRKAAGDSTT
jgi:integrase/recombinase XerC